MTEQRWAVTHPNDDYTTMIWCEQIPTAIQQPRQPHRVATTVPRKHTHARRVRAVSPLDAVISFFRPHRAR